MDVDIRVENCNNYDISNSFVYLQSNCVSFFPLAKIVNVVVKCVTDYSNDPNSTRELYDRHSVPNEISDDGTEITINTMIIRRWYDGGYGPFQDDFEDTIRNTICHATIDYYKKFGTEYHIECGKSPLDFPNPIMLVIKGIHGTEPLIGEIIKIDTDIRRGGMVKTSSTNTSDFLFRQLICAYAIKQKELNQDNHENN